MPWTGLVNDWTRPKTLWARAWFGARDRALVKAALAAAKCAFQSSVIRLAPIAASTRAEPTRASILSGSSARARSKKACARVMYSAVVPLFSQAQPWKYRSMASGWVEHAQQVEQVTGRSGQAIETADHQHIAGTETGDKASQLFPIGLRTADHYAPTR